MPKMKDWSKLLWARGPGWMLLWNKARILNTEKISSQLFGSTYVIPANTSTGITMNIFLIKNKASLSHHKYFFHNNSNQEQIFIPKQSGARQSQSIANIRSKAIWPEAMIRCRINSMDTTKPLANQHLQKINPNICMEIEVQSKFCSDYLLLMDHTTSRQRLRASTWSGAKA